MAADLTISSVSRQPHFAAGAEPVESLSTICESKGNRLPADSSVMRVITFAIACLLLLASLFVPSLANAASPGDIISPPVTVTYTAHGNSYSLTDDAPFKLEDASNAGSAPTDAELTVWGLDQEQNKQTNALSVSPLSADATNITLSSSQCLSSNNTITTTAVKNIDGSTLATPASYHRRQSKYYKIGEPLIVQIKDLDQNINNLVRETVKVNITSAINTPDSETVVLTETELDSGLFIGVVNTSRETTQTQNCLLSLTSGAKITANYVDDNDSLDLEALNVVFDPSNRIFDSNTGELLNDIEVTIINTSTGLPAAVFGDDGVSTFPATVKSGGSYQDSSGKTYAFAEGTFRFPYLAPGNYQLSLPASVRYTFPSIRSQQVLQVLDNAPFELSDSSYGNEFTLSSNVFLVDVPVDAKGDRIIITKATQKQEAGVGDFVQFDIQVKNAESDATGIQVIDELPAGLTVQKDSILLNGNKYQPTFSGQTMSFALADMKADELATISYVTQVSPLAQNAKQNILENIAYAQHPELKTNIARARVTVKDDFYNQNARLFGHVTLNDCEGNLAAEGVSGIRLIMEDGRYVVTDGNGEWHIENIKAGTHVIQIDEATLPPYLEVGSCDNNFKDADNALSQFVDLEPGSFWRADFTLKLRDTESGNVSQSLSNALLKRTGKEYIWKDNQGIQIPSPVKHKVHYTAQLAGNGTPIFNAIEHIQLPKGFYLEIDSVTIDGQSIEKQLVKAHNQSIEIQLGDLPKQWKRTIEFNALIGDSALKGNQQAQAWLSFSTQAANQNTGRAISKVELIVPPEKGKADPKKPLQFGNLSDQLAAEDKKTLAPVIAQLKGLKQLKLNVIGHTDSRKIPKRSQLKFKDNQSLSAARADMVADYLAQQLEIPRSNIQSKGMGANQPIAPNYTAAGRAKNRRVEIRVTSAISEISALSEVSAPQIVSTQSFDFTEQATASGIIDTQQLDGFYQEVEPPTLNGEWFNKQTSEVDFVWPVQGAQLDISSTQVWIKHPTYMKVKLFRKGEEVHAVYFRDVVTSKQKRMQVSIWKGIEVDEGDNEFEVFVYDKNDKLISRKTKDIHFASAPAKAKLIDALTIARADGATKSVVAVQFLDKDGFPVRKGTKGSVELSSPYELYNSDEFNYNPLFNNTHKGYEVGTNGIALIELKPTTQSGELTLTFDHSNGQQDIISTWIESQQDDWILVGLGDMTIGKRQISGNANNTNQDNDIYHDGRVAFYAKGQVTGKWLLTAAYDSAKEEKTPFADIIDPTETYTLYGDASQQGAAASSGKKLFVKIERERFYALFGDLSTGLNNTHLGRYVRNLTGIQVVYLGDLFEINAFGSDSELGYVRDEIQGDGTSGLYQLSNKFITYNTDKVILQTRDRINTNTVIEEHVMTRHTDYSIDYNTGAIYFKRPISPTDNNFNPVFIVASYEIENPEAGHIIGGRAGIKILDQHVKAGVTGIEDDAGETVSHLTGLDAEVSIDNWQVKAEVARTNKEEQLANNKETNTDGRAARAEITYRGKDVQVKALASRIEQDFGLSQQSTSEQNLKSVQVETTLYPSDANRIQIKALHQQAITTEEDKQLGEFNWTHLLSNTTSINAGVLSSIEERDNAENRYVDEATLGASWLTLQQKLKLSSSVIGSISERSESNDRARLGAEYRWTSSLSSIAEYERSFDQSGFERTSIGLRTQPWSGASVDQTVTQERQDDGYRLYSVSGVKQDVKLNDNWLVSFGFDQSRNLETIAPEETAQSTDNFYATNVGWGYRDEQWQWNNRFGQRTAETSRQWSGITSLYHPLSDALATGGSFNFISNDLDNGFNQTQDLTLDLALRPRLASYAVLLQSRIAQTKQRQASNPNSESKKWVNNVHVNWMVTEQNQLAGQYGIKKVLDQYNLEDYNSLTDYMAFQFRSNITQVWDIGLHGRRLHQYDNQQSLYNTGVSVGVTPVKNFWASVGYNFNGFEDNDFSAANFTSKGIYLKLRFKVDQNSLSGMRQMFGF